jgi:hypothetical protein
MTRKAYILVFSSRSTVFDDAKALAKILDEGDKMYAFDGNVVFLFTAQTVDSLTERLRAGPIGEGQFFLADVGDTSRAGNMTPKFWSLLHSVDELSSAA